MKARSKYCYTKWVHSPSEVEKFMGPFLHVLQIISFEPSRLNTLINKEWKAKKY